MNKPDNSKYLLFGGTFLLANKLQFVGDKEVKGLSTKQWFLMRNIIDLPQDPPPTITQVARSVDSTRQNIAKMLSTLEREGLVTIESSELDQRSRSVRLTASGVLSIQQTTENGQAFLNRLYDGIDEKELDTAGRVLDQMVENLLKIEEEYE